MYIDVKPYENTPFNLDKNLVNANANEAAKKMFAFMQEKFQNKIISGVMTADVLNNNTNGALALNDQPEVKHIRSNSGNKTPALVGFDFMHGTGKEYNDNNGGWNLHYTNATIALAKELYQKGGIPHYCWHWRDPLKNDKGFYSPNSNGSDKTTFDLTKACASTSCAAWNTNSNEYKGMVEDIDKVADYLKELQTAGVAVLWRPVHEASGGWFWWGAKGAAAFKLLYELIYSRLTTHHGLNNLIWVWNSEGADPDWYPGDNRVDIIGRDTYVDNHGSLIGEFEKLKNLFGTKKMIALSENGPVPYPANLVDDNAGWSFFMPWYGQYTTQQNTTSDWRTIMGHNYVITLEDMPGWSAYVPPPLPSSSSTNSTPSSSSSSSGNAPSSSSSSDEGNAYSSSSSSSGNSNNAQSSSSSETNVSPLLNSQFSILNSNPPIYYTLKGIPLGETKPNKPGVYIVKEKHSIKKIVVR
jgi:mannan endo-1,4-beta-mannosidase